MKYLILYLSVGLYFYLMFAIKNRKSFWKHEFKSYLLGVLLILLWPILPWVME